MMWSRPLSRKRNLYMKVRSFALVVSFLLTFQFAKAQEEVTLDQVIALALENNYDVQLAKNISLSGLTAKRYANAVFLPQVNATGSLLFNQNDQTVRYLDATKNASGQGRATVTNGNVSLTWTLFDGTKMFVTRNRLNTIAEQGELIVKEQMVNTVAAIITGYYDIVRQKQQLLAIQEQMAVSEERVKLADRKLQVGTGGKPELLQARVDYNAQRTQVIQQEAIIIQLKEQLNALVGTRLPQTYDVADSIIINLDLRPEDVSNLEEKNFSLRVSKLNMEIANMEKRERQAELSPVIAFTSSFLYTLSDNTKLIDQYAALYRKNQELRNGLTINIPVFNRFNTRSQIQQAYVNYSRQRILYDQLNTNLNVQLKNAYVNYDNAKKVLLIEEETILLAKENVFIALESFKRSVATFIELRTAQQSLADAYNRLITARYNAKVAETELLRISGALIK